MASVDDLVSLIEGGYETVKGGTTVRLIDPVNSDGRFCAVVLLEREGASVPFNNPWYVINPPDTAPDGSTNAGDVLDSIVAGSGFFDA